MTTQVQRYIFRIGSKFGPWGFYIHFVHMYEIKRMEGFKWSCSHVDTLHSI